MEKKIYRIIQEGNDKIEKFMKQGGRNRLTREFQNQLGLPERNYDNSWDMLMPVIGKISSNCEEPEKLDDLKYALLCDDIETAWKFVVDYLD